MRFWVEVLVGDQWWQVGRECGNSRKAVAEMERMKRRLPPTYRYRVRSIPPAPEKAAWMTEGF